MSAPALSVVIPARNAASTLGDQLDALLAQPCEQPWEIVVADNGSTDGTAAVVDERARGPVPVRRIGVVGHGVAHCRNAGIAAARAPAIAMCDADDVVAPGWLRAMGDALAEHPFVTGPLEIDLLNPEWVVETRGRALTRGPGDFFGRFTFAHSCNVGFQRDAVERVGGFAEDLSAGEDVELSFRLWRAGIELTYVPEAVVHYRYRTELRGLWQQARAYGRVKPVLLERFAAAGVTITPGGSWRGWLWLLRHLPLLATRAGRASWLWTAAGRVGEVEGRLHTRSGPRSGRRGA